MGKMVVDDVAVDVNGVPIEIPEPYYQRVPLYKTEEGTYLDWVRRKGTASRQMEGIIFEINRLKLEVEKFHWEWKLRARPPLSPEDYECNKKITDILEGTFTFLRRV